MGCFKLFLLVVEHEWKQKQFHLIECKSDQSNGTFVIRFK